MNKQNGEFEIERAKNIYKLNTSIAEEHNLERISPRYSVCTQCRYTRDHHLGGNENVHLGTKKEEETE